MKKTDLQKLLEENEKLKGEIAFLKSNNELSDFSKYFDLFSKHIINELNVIVFVKDIDDDYRYCMVNTAFCSLMGTTSSQLIGHTDADLFPQKVACRFRQCDLVALAQNLPYTFVEEIYAGNNKKHILRTKKSIINTPDGKRFLVGISHDITEEVEHKIKLQVSLNRERELYGMMNAVFHELPSAILVKNIDDDYRFVGVNKKFESMIGLSSSQLVGKTDYDIFSHEEADKYRADDIEASTCVKDKPKIINEVVSSSDGTFSTRLQTLKFALKINKKKLLICVGIDVTRQHEMMNELQLALQEAQKADRLKSKFITNISHEIRTPLNAIIGFSQLLTDTEDKEEIAQFNKIITANNTQLLSIIGNILDLSLLEAEALHLVKVPYFFDEMFSEIIRNVNSRFINTDVDFIVHTPPGKLQVIGDRTKTMKVVENLLSNSFKFTTEGFVKLSYSYTADYIEVVIKDTGIGIKSEDVGRIFRKFEKIDDFTQGTGLGLPICKIITEKMGGEIKVESSFGVGSVFYFRFPVNIA